jgi:deoxyribodipyrimidine photo-lyase
VGAVTLIHPWSLAPVAGPVVGIVATDFHVRWPWSRQRWSFVMRRMRELCGDAVVVGSVAELLERLGGRSLRAVEPLNPGYRELLVRLRASTVPVPRYFDDPDQPCRSFSQFWQCVTKA